MRLYKYSQLYECGKFELMICKWQPITIITECEWPDGQDKLLQKENESEDMIYEDIR